MRCWILFPQNKNFDYDLEFVAVTINVSISDVIVLGRHCKCLTKTKHS